MKIGFSSIADRLPKWIAEAKKKIEDDAGDPRFIKTVWGVGFMLDTKGNP